MNSYSDETYGERAASVYDDWHSYVDPNSISLLAELAGSGRALELGIGTGRLALPLASQGVNVSGIDVAPSMIERLKSKAGSDRSEVHLGNFADVKVEGEFALVYIVFNTFFLLLSQE